MRMKRTVTTATKQTKMTPCAYPSHCCAVRSAASAARDNCSVARYTPATTAIHLIRSRTISRRMSSRSLAVFAAIRRPSVLRSRLAIHPSAIAATNIRNALTAWNSMPLPKYVRSASMVIRNFLGYPVLRQGSLLCTRDIPPVCG